MCVCVCVWEEWTGVGGGGVIGQTAGGVIVLLDSQSDLESSVNSGLTLSLCLTANQIGTGFENNTTHWLAGLAPCPVKHACSNLASELHCDFQFACKGIKPNLLSLDKEQTTLKEEVSINTEFICNTGYMCYFI